MVRKFTKYFLLAAALIAATTFSVHAQGVTTAAVNGVVAAADGESLPGANVLLVHQPTGTQYGASTRDNGLFNILNVKVGGPYTITVSFVGYVSQKQENIYLNLGQNLRLDFKLTEDVVNIGEVVVQGETDKLFNSTRTGAETFITPQEVTQLPSIKRSTRDLTRLDPRSDGNYSFGGKNWLYNSISVDGSYFNNSFGLDDPAPGGQTGAEPIPFDAVEQVQVSVAPFDIREGGFTGAGINTVTKSGTNKFKASVYSFVRNEALIGNKVRGNEVVANPDLSFNQSGFTISGPIIQNKLFFFINGEIERREDPGTNFNARTGTGALSFGQSRVQASVMDQIRQRMIDVYGYDPGAYQGYINETNNEKILLKLDWNINDHNNFTFRYNYLNAIQDKPPHPFVLSINNTGRGPNESSLPFENSGYRMNNQLSSFAMELNSRYQTFSNRFFASYNRFRDFREPKTEAFPTVEIGQDGLTYTTLGTEPFSSHNILDQDIWQFTNNFSSYSGDHVYTFGVNFEYYSFFNAFNIFRNGVFFLPYYFGIGSTFATLDEFFAATDPNAPGGPFDLRGLIGTGPFKGENIEVGQLAFYAQDEYSADSRLNLTYGLRVDIPMYFTDPVDNPFSRSLLALDENRKHEKVDQSKLPSARPLFSPRIGFNWDVNGDRTTQLRGGTGIFTGRVPFVWIGNIISNPGANPNLYPAVSDQVTTKDDAILQQSFDLNAMVSNFRWPQVWNTNLAIDQKLPWGLDGTVEVLYGKDINSIYVRNADLVAPVRRLNDGRPYYGGAGNNELNPDGGAGIYVIDNSDEGYNFNLTFQLRKQFDFGLNAMAAYSFTEAKNLMQSTEIASVLWQANPVKGDPNKPELGFSQFGHRHRIIAGGTYSFKWSENASTSIGLFMEIADGNSFAGAGGNRYSFVYAGDVNGDGQGGNDLIYIPRNRNEISLDSYVDAGGNTVSADQQWALLDAFINQDDYLSEHRGEIAERSGGVNPWYSNIDLRILQDFSLIFGTSKHTFQLSVDVLNVANLISSDWGVRKVASASATSPLELTRFNESGNPVFNYKGGAQTTYVDDPSLFSRWQMQIGLRYFFE